MKLFQPRIGVLLVLLIGFLVAAPPAKAALTETQIQSVLNLLIAFSVDAPTIVNVNNTLHGTASAGATTTIIATTTSTTAATTTPAATAPVITRTLYLGLQGDDVLSLQQYFITQGLLAPSSATGFFGPLTQAAVQKLQAKNNLVSSGSPNTTGWGVVGPITRALITKTWGSGSSASSGTPGSSTASPTTPNTTPGSTSTSTSNNSPVVAGGGGGGAGGSSSSGGSSSGGGGSGGGSGSNTTTTACANPVGSTPDVRLCTVTRFAGNPLISPSTPGAVNNITMPSVLKVPSWVSNPLGAYYMYFASHNGSYIRLAYANSPTGPWTIYAPGSLKDTMVAPFSNTISSPDVFAMDASHKIRMYFSTNNYPGSTQEWSGVSESTDGINFTLTSTQNIAKYYLRVWQWAGQYFGLAKGWSTAPAELGVSPDGIASFAPIQTLTANGSIRHMAVLLKGDVLMLFYSTIGDAPERIYLSTIKLSSGPATSWALSTPVEVLRPTLAYEGANYPNVASIKGPALNVNELRDPYILEDNGHTYLYYGIAGESGIAVAEITYQMIGTTASTPAPTVSLSISPNSITSSQSATLTWSSTNASNCTASNGWTGLQTTSGTQSVSPTADTTYTLTCMGAGGSTSQSTSITVSAPSAPPPSAPTVTISASPTSITSGQSSTLTWSSTDATSCTASNGWSGSQSTSGTQSVSPTADTTYTLTCTGTGGSANQSTTITVTAAGPAPGVLGIGSHIQLKNSFGLRNPPSDTTIVGTQPSGATGTVVGGPYATGGGSDPWWQIDFDTGTDGWAKTSSITVL